MGSWNRMKNNLMKLNRLEWLLNQSYRMIKAKISENKIKRRFL